MKLLRIIVQMQYLETIESIIEDNGARFYISHRVLRGRDSEGKHEDNRVYPGAMALVEAELQDEAVEDVADALEHWRTEREVHGHLRMTLHPMQEWWGGEETQA